jgi:seryl-tRNA synthetase
MLDMKFIRENTELVKAGVRLKNEAVDIDDLLAKDDRRRKIIFEVENLKKKRNENSKAVAVAKKEGKTAAELIEETKTISDKIKILDDELAILEQEIRIRMSWVPNLPHPTCPRGNSAQENVVVKEWGNKTVFDFKVKDHLEIGKHLDILDFIRGGKISGSGFPVYKGLGARLERVLINFMLDIHTTKHGYQEIFPPFMVNRTSMFATAQLPKLEDDMYQTEKDDLFLIPTAEVPVTNLHREEILAQAQLPLKYVAYSACFRREAGSYGKETRGFLRVHQFNKVELINFSLPDQSYNMHEQMLLEATKILELLEIPYRVLVLATGDMSFAAAKCYDIETWSPAEEQWLETSSVSNVEDFQARRANIRYRREADNKLEFVHTLNGSGLATSRLMVSLLENYQTDEGTVIIPEVLRPYMDNRRVISKEYSMHV